MYKYVLSANEWCLAIVWCHPSYPLPSGPNMVTPWAIIDSHLWPEMTEKQQNQQIQFSTQLLLKLLLLLGKTIHLLSQARWTIARTCLNLLFDAQGWGKSSGQVFSTDSIFRKIYFRGGRRFFNMFFSIFASLSSYLMCKCILWVTEWCPAILWYQPRYPLPWWPHKGMPWAIIDSHLWPKVAKNG